jgi:hypothetical protein
MELDLRYDAVCSEVPGAHRQHNSRQVIEAAAV